MYRPRGKMVIAVTAISASSWKKLAVDIDQNLSGNTSTSTR